MKPTMLYRGGELIGLGSSGSMLAEQPPEVARRVREGLRWFVGGCPRCGRGFEPESVIYRSSRRSVTMRCARCGLQWTMTIHQIAKAVQRLASGGGSMSFEDAIAWSDPAVLRDLLAWATDVGETRGRRRADAGQHDGKPTPGTE